MDLDGSLKRKTDELLTWPLVQWRLEARQDPSVEDLRELNRAQLGIITDLSESLIGPQSLDGIILHLRDSRSCRGTSLLDCQVRG